MPWVKKKGLYLPDPTSYAQSVNAFQDDYGGDPGYLYVRVGFKIVVPEDPPTSLIGWELVQKHDSSSGWAHIVRWVGTVPGGLHHSTFRWVGEGEGAVGYPVNLYGVAELFMRYDSAKTNFPYKGIHWLNRTARGYSDLENPLTDPLSHLVIAGSPNADITVYVDHLIIHNDWLSWVDKDFESTQYGWDMFLSVYPSFDEVPLGIDLHWAMEEGLIDPTQFLHFYTFQELDENGRIPDYGSNPQPLALYGNAQLAEAWELEPQFSPTVVYELHALRTEAKMRALRMRARLRREKQ